MRPWQDKEGRYIGGNRHGRESWHCIDQGLVQVVSNSSNRDQETISIIVLEPLFFFSCAKLFVRRRPPVTQVPRALSRMPLSALIRCEVTVQNDDIFVAQIVMPVMESGACYGM